MGARRDRKVVFRDLGVRLDRKVVFLWKMGKLNGQSRKVSPTPLYRSGACKGVTFDMSYKSLQTYKLSQ